MRNITAAVSRLSFAKKAKIRILDAKKGLVVFTPDPGQKFDYDALAKAYKRASYGIKQVELTASGILEEQPDPTTPGQKTPALAVKDTGNVFLLRPGEGTAAAFPAPGSEATVTGLLQPGKGAPDTLVVEPISADEATPGSEAEGG